MAANARYCGVVSLLKALTVGTDGPTNLPHLRCLSLRLDREPATYSGGLNMAHLYDFVAPGSNLPLAETHPDATLILLRSWAKVNAPKLDFRIWFEDI
ncbi:hypothetical protein BKA70DRAFT_1441370 [Coprinopsis sp. MPI-PUGE-AT-0042]|nr:hypothetical protein BKA70DRAFT_1441370 [Coprinopsis sp. MPI-PUGE-AT-0042]